MKKKIIIISLVLLVPVMLIAQATEGVKADSIGRDSAQQNLAEISVTKFEEVAYWGSAMALDDGIVIVRRFEGSPLDKQPIEGEEEANIEEQDRFVLGARVDFIRRGNNVMHIFPVKPLPIEGLTKTLSVWVVGRNYNHWLKIVLADYFNQTRELTVGKLNHMGWKKFTVAVPPYIVQDEFHFTAKRGLKFLGFKIEFDLEESYGSYYIYFDDLRAVSDLFAEEYRDTDDMTDGW